MRGKGDENYPYVKVPRITPAHAGKSLFARALGVPFWDHPRACGEKPSPLFPASTSLGSPPRMRGKGEGGSAIGVYFGITPAHAGKSHRSAGRKHRKKDHPRACGEKKTKIARRIARMGSPPRMRGKEFTVTVENDRARITPAHAGKRRPPRRSASHLRDHPRACGEKAPLDL